MSLQFTHPLWLLAAAPLLAHLLYMARRLRLLAPARRVAAVVIRAIVILMLVGALAGARIPNLSSGLTTIFVVDRSDSIPEGQRQYEQLFVQSAVASMDPSLDQAGIVVFGAEAAIEEPPNPQPEFIEPRALVNSARTNIAGAIQLALASLPEQRQKRIVLLSDGNANAGDAEAAARAAAAAKVPIDVVPLQYENRNDVILEKAIVENRINVDEPFDLVIVASSRAAARGRLSIHQDGRLIGQHDVELQAGERRRFVYSTQVLDPGFHQFEVQLDAPGDAIPENNRTYAFTYGLGEPRVLLVDGDANPSPVLAAMLQSEKINVQHVTPSGLPASLRELQTYDTLIFNNVAASDISGEQMRMVERAEHDLGVGFIMIGGEHSFGAGGYNDSPIERILPVDMELKNERIMPKGALVTVVHTVEIPEGQYWCIQIVRAALDVLSANDEMGVLYYNWQANDTWLYPLQEVGDKSRMRALIDGIQPGDMRSFDRTLQMAHAALAQSSASIKHVVIISDGDPDPPAAALVRQIQQAGITVSAVCINPHNPRDVQVMQAVAHEGGGNFYYPTNFSQLPQIFTKEAATVRKSLIFEEPFTPRVKQYSPLLVGLDAYPELKGYIATSPKDLADVPLITQHEDPLFAHWQHGLGRTAAFTSDAKERWAATWTSWNQFAKFWSQAVRWTLRSAANPNYQMQMSVDGAQGRITVDAVDTAGEFKNFLKVGGTIINPDMTTQQVELRQTSAGRYEGRFDVSRPGVYMLGAEASDPAGGAADLITGGTTLSYSPEFQNSRSNLALLGRLADLTGGRTLDPRSPVFLRSQVAYAQPTPLWPALLTVLLFFFLADVFVRRVLIGWRDVGAGLAIAWRWTADRLRPRRVEAHEPTEALLKAKQAAHEQQIAPRESDAARRAAFLESLKHVDVEGSPDLDRGADKVAIKRPAAPQETPAAPTPTDDDSFTSQLLKARRRAHPSESDSNEGDNKP